MCGGSASQLHPAAALINSALGYDSDKCFDSRQKSINNNSFSQTPHFKIMKTFHKVTSVSNIESKSSERVFLKFWEQMGGVRSQQQLAQPQEPGTSQSQGDQSQAFPDAFHGHQI